MRCIVFNLYTQRSTGRRFLGFMKRFLSVLGIVCSFVIGAATTASAETIAVDTVLYKGEWKIVVHTIANDYGEINVCYVCYPIDANSSKEDTIEVQANNETYENDKATYIIRNEQDSSCKRVTNADITAVNIGEEGEK